mgnify:CR=1 FL=1
MAQLDSARDVRRGSPVYRADAAGADAAVLDLRCEGHKFLFIAAETVEKEQLYGLLYQYTVSDRSALWIVPGAGHTQGLFVQPEEYRTRVVSFFDEALGTAK